MRERDIEKRVSERERQKERLILFFRADASNDILMLSGNKDANVLRWASSGDKFATGEWEKKK